MHKYLKIISLIISVCFVATVLAACSSGGSSLAASVSSRVTTASITVPAPPPQSAASSSLPQSTAQSTSVSSQVSSVSSEMPPQPAPEFLQGGITVGEIEGKTVPVQIKTNVPSAVNYIISTSGQAVSVAQFYDYANRGIALEGAVSSGAAYMVDENGKTLSITLPDTAYTYYLLLNAAENETNTWQNSVTVIKIYETDGSVPALVGAAKRLDDTDTDFVWQIETTRQTRAYVLVGPAGWDAPTKEQVRAGSGYALIYKTYQVDVNTAASPYTANISMVKSEYSPGSYTAWLVLQDAGSDANPVSEVSRLGDFQIS